MFRNLLGQAWEQTQNLPSASTWALLLLGMGAVLGAGILAGLQGRKNPAVAVTQQKFAAKPSAKRKMRRKNGWRGRKTDTQRGGMQCDLGMVCLEVATRLEAGASPEKAWRAGLSGLSPELGLEDLRHPERIATKKLRKLFRQPAQRRAARALVAAADLSQHLGSPLAQVLAQCAQGISGATRAQLERQSAQTGPRASARLLGALPLVALLGASALGVDLVTLFSEGGWVRFSLIFGLVALVVGNLWSYYLIRQADRDQSEQLDTAWGMELCAAALQAGSSIPQAIDALGRCLADNKLTGCGKLLILGASWEETWQRAGARWQGLSQALRPAWEDGASPVPLLVAAARKQTEQAGYEAKIAAEKLAVRLVLPLGLCLLPAFLALGVVPVIISTLHSLVL